MKNIINVPEFTLWANNFIKKSYHIISKKKPKYSTRTHKFGTKITKQLKQAMAIYQSKGNTLWQDEVLKEIENTKISFEVFYGTERGILSGYQNIGFHVIFDVNMVNNFCRKYLNVRGWS